MEFLINVDIKAIPIPLPDTIKISTNSRFRLKYCAHMSVEQSRDIPVEIFKIDGMTLIVAIILIFSSLPTPIPTTVP
jgi:hypothetical protein